MSAARSLMVASFLIVLVVGTVQLVSGELTGDVVNMLVGLGGLLISVAGFVRGGAAPERAPRALRTSSRAGTTPRPAFRVSLDAGFFGGFAGGVIGGLVVALAYVRANPGEAGEYGFAAQIVAACTVSGALLGLSSQLLLALLAHTGRVRHRAWPLEEVAACLAGGIVSGALIGPPLGWHFGRQPHSYLEPADLFPGALVGAIVIVLSLAVFDRGGWSWFLLRSALLAVVVGAIAAGLGLALMHVFGLYDLLFEFFVGQPSTRTYVLGGAIYGVCTGAVLGIVMGTTLILDRVWSGSAPRSAPRPADRR